MTVWVIRVSVTVQVEMDAFALKFSGSVVIRARVASYHRSDVKNFLNVGLMVEQSN